MFEELNSRREFLRITGLVSLGFLGLPHLNANNLSKARLAAAPRAGYGPLVKDPKGILNLPQNFSYTIISRQGESMNDGLVVPGHPDGMGTFPGQSGRTILIRNHENSADAVDQGPFGPGNRLLNGIDRNKMYDLGKGSAPELGGTTTIVYNPVSGKVEQQFLSLGGTARNCAGGVTPWNSWITCEETTHKPGTQSSAEQEHGYVFEVPATAKPLLHKAIPVKAMGRMNHEAVAVDPATSIVYLTEDRSDGLFYRYLPVAPGKLLRGGRLQALAIRDQHGTDTRNWEKLEGNKFPLHTAVEVEWIDIENVESPADDLRQQGFSKGAARFARGEGIWFGKDELYFACTNGGKLSQGQVFRYRPARGQAKGGSDTGGTLELFAEPNDHAILKSCDNLTVSPWGDLILCEDDPHPFIVGVTPAGDFYKFAENTGYESEFAGGVFSPGGETFFVNIQGPGLTLAIKGPWRS